MEFSNSMYDLGSPVSAGPLQVLQLAEDLKLSLELRPSQEERNNLRAQLPAETAQALVDWLQSGAVSTPCDSFWCYPSFQCWSSSTSSVYAQNCDIKWKCDFSFVCIWVCIRGFQCDGSALTLYAIVCPVFSLCSWKWASFQTGESAQLILLFSPSKHENSCVLVPVKHFYIFVSSTWIFRPFMFVSARTRLKGILHAPSLDAAFPLISAVI